MMFYISHFLCYIVLKILLFSTKNEKGYGLSSPFCDFKIGNYELTDYYYTII